MRILCGKRKINLRIYIIIALSSYCMTVESAWPTSRKVTLSIFCAGVLGDVVVLGVGDVALGGNVIEGNWHTAKMTNNSASMVNITGLSILIVLILRTAGDCSDSTLLFHSVQLNVSNSAIEPGVQPPAARQEVCLEFESPSVHHSVQKVKLSRRPFCWCIDSWFVSPKFNQRLRCSQHRTRTTFQKRLVMLCSTRFPFVPKL